MTLVGKQVGPYRILRELGRGGVGVVYLAQHVDLGRHDALKILLPEYAGDERLTRVIMDDAKIAASLSHPNIVTVYTIGVHEGRPYFAMELLEGEWLDQRIKRSPLDPQTAARVMREVSQALDHAHKHNVVHLDVKPNNIFVGGKNRQLKLTDFGIARHFREDQRTHHGGMVGTPAYMAPEQFDEKIGRIGPPTDIYSLGVVLFEMLTGRQPYQADNHWGIVRQHLKEERPRPSRVRPALGNTFDRPVAKAMAVAPGQRHKSAVDFAVEVAKAANVTTVHKVPELDWRMVAAVVAAIAIIGIAALTTTRGVETGTGGSTDGSQAIQATDTPFASGVVLPSSTDTPRDDNDLRADSIAVLATDTPSALTQPTSKASGDPREPAHEPADESRTPVGSRPMRITLTASVSREGCIHVTWEPRHASDTVNACFGAGCPPLGIYVGDSAFTWDPSKPLTNRPDLTGSAGMYRLQVVSADGSLMSDVVSVEWLGGCSGPVQQEHRDSAPTSTPVY